MKANIKIKNLRQVSGEMVGSIIVKSSKLKPISISKDVSKFIDELPILFIISALTKGTSKFRNIGDLRHKESNRLLESKKILVQAGIKCKMTNESMTIYGKEKICMSSAILSLATGIKMKIKNFETVNTSFPGFISLINNQLRGNIEVRKK